MSNLGSLILAIDTSSRRASVALARGGRLVALFGLETDAQQSIELWETVDLVLVRAGCVIREVTAFAVCRGPGSFTGLRVGLTAALGFAHPLGRPLYAATSLELTARASGAGEDVWALLNAHRGEVYAQRFRVGEDGVPVPRSEPVVAPPERILDELGDGPTRFVGDGAELYRDLIAEAAASRGGLEEPAVATPARRWQIAPAPAFLAGELAALASRYTAEGREPDRLEPCYVRPSEAEINLKLGRLGRRPSGTE